MQDIIPVARFGAGAGGSVGAGVLSRTASGRGLVGVPGSPARQLCSADSTRASDAAAAADAASSSCSPA